MTFAVTNTFVANTTALASEVNTNFSDIETELNAFPTNGALKAGGVGSAALAASAVTTAKIADLAVTEAKLAANSVTSGKIAAGAVTLADISGILGSASVLATATTTVDAGETNVDVASAAATTDGFLSVVCTWTGADGDQWARAELLTDSSDPPTTVHGYALLSYLFDRTLWASQTIPVKKGEYYKGSWIGISGDDAPVTRTWYWRALGS